MKVSVFIWHMEFYSYCITNLPLFFLKKNSYASYLYLRFLLDLTGHVGMLGIGMLPGSRLLNSPTPSS